MSYEVLSRKYRPNSFEELVGQKHVAQTLSNASKLNRIAEFYARRPQVQENLTMQLHDHVKTACGGNILHGLPSVVYIFTRV